ncbi:hypothetical protein J2046_003314 [Rhizobium petrolearium]|nr:hypothetical protein [Neorhizobium petrolearium]
MLGRAEGDVARQIKALREIDRKNRSSFPALFTRACNHPVPHRIHRKAFRRGGAGAGGEGRTRNLIVRVRGKWSPSGDTGEAKRLRTGRLLPMPEQRAGRGKHVPPCRAKGTCSTQRAKACFPRSLIAGGVGRHTWWPDGWFRRIFQKSAERVGNRRQKTVRKGQGRGTGVADKNRRTGR